jgi:hypothetical protein
MRQTASICIVRLKRREVDTHHLFHTRLGERKAIGRIQFPLIGPLRLLTLFATAFNFFAFSS